MVGTTASHRRSGAAATIVALVTAIALLSGAPVAIAAPDAPDEGGNESLRDVLEAASKGHIEAKAKLDNSKKRQRELTEQYGKLQQRLAELTTEVGVMAAESYRVGRLTSVTMLLNSASPEAMLQRAAGLEVMAQREGRNLRALAEAHEQSARAKAAIDNEVREQEKQVAIMARKKQDAERALAAVGGQATGGFVSANSPAAKAAPRNSDGSWPSESCSVDDPTTSGCITPRTLHAMNEAKLVGFTRYTSCFRSGGGGEHPKGRACDFSAEAGGFAERDATGGDRTYGNNLAAFYVRNADRLGVLYVIWFRQIWMPGTGWRSYSGGGSPAGDHTNHVHLSVV
ncbi:coiled-coil domain-containing protein [Solwaraspora sp. WMMB335]|uniref:coiled-coil domain-containing protein n=1 Tax=Solwaraspora sp. WMMB335 TaxID=3404118 RepID=UPI003B925C4B